MVGTSRLIPATFNLATFIGLSVSTKGTITLHDITADNNSTAGAYLNNTSGTGDVLVDPSEFNDNTTIGLNVNSNGAITLSDVSASGTTGGDGAALANNTGSGDVQVSASQFNENANRGLAVNSKGNITLTNTSAISNSSGSGVSLNNSSIAGKDVLVDTGTFNGNFNDGLNVQSAGKITVSSVTANLSSNGDGVELNNTASIGYDVVVDPSTFNANAANGLFVFSGGAITVMDVTATNNIGGSGAHLDNSVTGYGVSVATGVFTGDFLNGVFVTSRGGITLTNVTANATVGGDGASLDNSGVTGYDVLVDPGTFNGNSGHGLKVVSAGKITVMNTNAISNTNGDGVHLENNAVTGYDVVVDTGVFTDNLESGLEVQSGGHITVSNVTANDNQTDNGAFLDNDGVTGYNVFVDPSTFNRNAGIGVSIFSGGTITLMDVTANGNFGGNGAYLDNDGVTGYDVLVATGLFSGNFTDGLYVLSSGNITLTNVTANDTVGGNGATLSNTGVTGYDVLVDPSEFSGNYGNGLKVNSGGYITLTDVTANGNLNGDGALLDNMAGTGDVSISASQFITNTGNGLVVNSNGNITLTNVTANDNQGGKGANLTNTGGSADVSVSASQFYTNTANGLDVSSKGHITVTGVTAIGNGSNGAVLNNGTASGNSDVSVSTSQFVTNTFSGLVVGSKGNITLTNVTANNNTLGSGAELNNAGVTGYDVLVDPSTFSGNKQSGLIVYSGGAITLTDVTANDNKTGDGARLTNNGVSGYNVLVATGVFTDNWESGLIVYSGGNITLTNVTANGNKTGDGAQLTNNSVSGYDVWWRRAFSPTIGRAV